MYNEKEENIDLDTQIVEDPCQDSVHDQLLSFFDRPLHFCLETEKLAETFKPVKMPSVLNPCEYENLFICRKFHGFDL